MENKTKPPFFIVGCVRSGTTMLRDILRMHPHLACPEETHFFRWATPFGTPEFNRTVMTNAVLARHRKMDGIEEHEFKKMVENSISRMDLYKRYMKLFMSRRKPEATRWFDKTPQNVYGAPIAAATPGVKFVHIVRNPVEVVASLRIGKVMEVREIIGACNYWNEAADILLTMKRAYPARVFEIRYEDFVAQPLQGISKILDFLNEPFDPSHYASVNTREVTHREESVLLREEVARVEQLCRAGRIRYGYEVGPVHR